MLTLFGEVRPGEGTTVVLLTFNVFLILSAYYLLKVAREPLILLGGGAEVKSYASVGQSILLVFVASSYGWLAARASVGCCRPRAQREARAVVSHEKVEAPLAHGNAFPLVLRDRYHLVLCALVLALNFVTKSGDYVLDRMLLAGSAEHAHALGVTQSTYIGQFKAHYFQFINVIGVGMQLFLVSRIVKYVGLRVALVVIPLASTVGYGATLFLPMIEVLFVARVIESSLDYSLSNTTQQSLWLVTTREAKYKAKQVIDTFFKRAGDTMSAALVWTTVHFALGTRTFLAVNVALSLAWVGLAVIVGRGYMRRSTTTQKAEGDRGRLPDAEGGPR